MSFQLPPCSHPARHLFLPNHLLVALILTLIALRYIGYSHWEKKWQWSAASLFSPNLLHVTRPSTKRHLHAGNHHWHFLVVVQSSMCSAILLFMQIISIDHSPNSKLHKARLGNCCPSQTKFGCTLDTLQSAFVRCSDRIKCQSIHGMAGRRVICNSCLVSNLVWFQDISPFLATALSPFNTPSLSEISMGKALQCY